MKKNTRQNPKETLRRKIKVTVETERILLVKQTQYEIYGWCKECGKPMTVVLSESSPAAAMGSDKVASELPLTHQLSTEPSHHLDNPHRLFSKPLPQPITGLVQRRSESIVETITDKNLRRVK